MKTEQSPEMNDVEHVLLDALLAGEHPVLAQLRRQIREAKIESRELSGVGFFLTFSVPESLQRLGKGRLVIGDVLFDLEGIENGGGAILFVDDGYVSMLEGYLNGEPQWPETPRLTRVFYDSNPRAVNLTIDNWKSQHPAGG